MAETVKVEGIKRHAGIAGQFSVTANVTYPGELTDRIEFVGSVYGGPVAMVLSNGTQTFVTEPDRFGKFGAEWVRRFFGVGASNFPCLNRAYGCARVAVEGRAYCQDHEPADSGSAVVGVLIFLPFLAGLAWLIGMVVGLVSTLQGVTS